MTDRKRAKTEGLDNKVDFDAAWYCSAYPDVEMVGMDPWEHFQNFGRAMGRKPNASGKFPPSLKIVANPPSQPHIAEETTGFASQALTDSYLSYTGLKVYPDAVKPTDLPKVTVVMTSHNATDTVVRAVESILFQTWPNLEVIIVDDASNDGTWQQISAMVSKYRGVLRAIRLQCNMGTYLAKNIGIREATGDIVMFQDSDDYSHPERVTVQALHLLDNPTAMGNRTRYCRFDPENGRIVKVSGHETKFGLITLAVRKTLFQEIGYFNAVRKAGDDEWFERARALAGRDVFKNLNVALYMAELRKNSLAQDLMSARGAGGITQIASGERAEYNAAYLEKHAEGNGDKKKFRLENPSLPIVSPPWVPDALAALPKSRAPVVATMCSIPARSGAMQKAVRSVINQVDKIHIYLDKYESVPSFLENDPRIKVTMSQNVEKDLRDNAKFLPYNLVKKELTEFHYVTLDDDIIYPYDYVLNHIMVGRQFSDQCVTGLHGVVYEERPTSYFKRRLVSHFRTDETKTHHLVNCLGTGTTAFHSSCFPHIDPFEWSRGGMVDVYFSIHAKAHKVPMICMARTANWMRDAESADQGPTLYDEFKEKDALIVAELISHAPWGYAGISALLSQLPDEESSKLEQFLPAFHDQVSMRDRLSRYRG